MAKIVIHSYIKDGSDMAKEIGLEILESQNFKRTSPIAQKLLNGEVIRVLNESNYGCGFKNKNGTFSSKKRAKQTLDYFDMWYIHYLGRINKDLRTLNQLYYFEEKF